MKTNTENLEAASLYWQRQCISAKASTTYVVASPSGLRVLTNDMAVMLAGACKPEQFTFENSARIHAKRLAETPSFGSFDEEPDLEVMTYEHFCEIQHARFEIALHTVRVADAMAYQHEAA